MYTIAIDIGGTKTAIACFDRAHKIVYQDKFASAETLASGPTPSASLATAIRTFCVERQIDLSQIYGIGIGFPGVMDRVTQTIVSCPNLQILDNQHLGIDLTANLSLPVFVENDVNLIALGEAKAGQGQGVTDLACVFVGSGIGSGLILNGELYMGADGAAGELGHVPVEPDGLLCTCGGVGCLEMYCSGKALSLQAARILGQDMSGTWADAQRLIEAARIGNITALAAIHRAFYYLGIGITTFVNILNVRLVILGGGIIDAWPEGIDIVRRFVQERARKEVRSRLRIEHASLGETAGLIGGSILVRRNLRGEG